MTNQEYLISKGWKLGSNKNEMLDPWQRAIRSVEDAYELQKAREVCDHKHTDKFTVKGITKCGFCGMPVSTPAFKLKKSGISEVLDYAKILDWAKH